MADRSKDCQQVPRRGQLDHPVLMVRAPVPEGDRALVLARMVVVNVREAANRRLLRARD